MDNPPKPESVMAIRMDGEERWVKLVAGELNFSWFRQHSSPQQRRAKVHPQSPNWRRKKINFLRESFISGNFRLT